MWAWPGTRRHLRLRIELRAFLHRVSVGFEVSLSRRSENRGRDTYVVFAQQPGKSGIAVTMKGSRGTTVRMLTQGLVWVDKKNFHIRGMRMDLLARQPEIGLDEQTTRVNFSEVHLPDLSTPLWLSRDVSASVKFRGADDANLLSLSSRTSTTIRTIDAIEFPRKW
jgi:hypothetical protein